MSSTLPPSRAEDDLSRDEVFEVLGNGRRRNVIRALRQADDAVELGELAERIAAQENDISVEEVSYQQRKRVYTALQQSHLPKMDEAGALDYDSDRGVIEAADELSQFDLYLEVVPRSGLPWSGVYLGLAIVCVGLAIASWAGLFPFSLVPPVVWGPVFVAGFVGVALLHYRTAPQFRTGNESFPDHDR